MSEEERKRIHLALNALRRATITCVNDSELWTALKGAEENLFAELHAIYERRGWGQP
jgi:hypothetical protein